MGRDRIVVFIGFGARSQSSLRRIILMLDKLRGYYDITVVHVPDDSLNGLPYIRIEPTANSEEDDPFEAKFATE